MSTPIPVILCGAMKPVATLIRSLLQPEFNVVYAGHNLPAAQNEVPLIIAGRAPSVDSLHTQVGSNDFTVPPRAVILGGGWSEAAFQSMYSACAEACGGHESIHVPFLRTDNSLTDKLAATGQGPAHSSPQYPGAVAQRLKNKLQEVGLTPGSTENPGGIAGKDYWF